MNIKITPDQIREVLLRHGRGQNVDYISAEVCLDPVEVIEIVREATQMHEVYVNGSAKYEGTLADCQEYARLRLHCDPTYEIQIEPVEQD